MPSALGGHKIREVKITAEVRTSDLRKLKRKAYGAAYERIVGHVHNELLVAAAEALEYAKRHQSGFFEYANRDPLQTRDSATTGLLANGLYHDRSPTVASGRIFVGLGWLRPYGRVLEYGPRVTEWIIRAKWAKALRFMSIDWVPMGRSGGSRGEDRVMYRRQVRHRWTKHSLRPHLNPSVEKVRPKLNRRIARAIARELAAA